MRSFELGNPYDVKLVKEAGDGPAKWSPLLLGTDLVVLNEEPREFKTRSGATGKLGVPNPDFISNKHLNVAAFYGEGWGFHNTPAYRNRARVLKSAVEEYTTALPLQDDRSTQTPVTIPNVIPHSYFSSVQILEK